MKIPKQINVKTALIFVGISILLTSVFFYAFAATPSSTFYISSGVYPGAPSYTVWREGSNYFAKDVNGMLKYSGTNASLIIQNCIDVLTDGGKIFLKKDTYDIGSTTLTFLKGIKLEIDFQKSALTSSVSTTPAINMSGDAGGNLGVTLKNLFLVKSGDKGTSIGILIQYAHRYSRLENICVVGFKQGFVLATLSD